MANDTPNDTISGKANDKTSGRASGTAIEKTSGRVNKAAHDAANDAANDTAHDAVHDAVHDAPNDAAPDAASGKASRGDGAKPRSFCNDSVGERSMSFTNVAVNLKNEMRTGDRPDNGSDTGECITNLVGNGSFERGLLGWRALRASVVGVVHAHGGRRAAALGTYGRNCRPAMLSQTMLLPEKHPRNLAFQLAFHASGRRRRPAPFAVAVDWLGGDLNVIGTGLRTSVPSFALGRASRGQWTAYNFVTDFVVKNASFVRLRFHKYAGRLRDNFLIIDDVSLVPVVPLCGYEWDDIDSTEGVGE